MITSFEKRHSWLSRKIKKKIWPYLNRWGNHSFNYKLSDLDFYIRINTRDDSLGKRMFFGDYEKGTVLLFKKLLQGGETVFDIGANIGFYSILCSRLVGDTGKVHSFEPSSREFLELCKNVSLNNINNIYLNQIGIGDNIGFSKLNVLKDAKYGAYNSIGVITHRYVQGAEFEKEIIRIVTIDSYCSNYSLNKLDILKVDVEGSEKLVFLGGKGLLESVTAPMIIFETNDMTLRNENGSYNDVVQLLIRYGYHIFNINELGNIYPYKIGLSQNAFAIKQAHLKKLECSGIKVNSLK